MLAFKEFLVNSSKNLSNWKKFNQIHIVLGNESCDLDSTISSLSYGYFLYKSLKLNNSSDAIVYPLLNVTKENFKIRNLACSLLKKFDLDLDHLCYRNEINFNEIINKQVKTYLVDHHVLNDNDKILEKTVVEIYDHRPLDKSIKWGDGVKLRIKAVASCCTLIADELLKSEHLFPELGYLLYSTIVFDAVALKPENGKAKPFDIEISKQLISKFNFDNDASNLYESMMKTHCDVTDLNASQLLVRDLKFVGNIPIPGLPSLVENFFKRDGAEEAVKEMAKINNASLVVLIGIEHNSCVERDVGLYFSDNPDFKTKLVDKFRKEMKEFQFSEVRSSDDLFIFRQGNIKLTRKQILPVIRDFFGGNIN